MRLIRILVVATITLVSSIPLVAAPLYQLELTGTFILTSGPDEQGINGVDFTVTFTTPANSSPFYSNPGESGFSGPITLQPVLAISLFKTHWTTLQSQQSITAEVWGLS